jgi:hypothetical protein
LKELNNQQPTTTEGEQPADDALEESQPETDTEI